MDDNYRRVLHFALAHRPTVVMGAAASIGVAVLLYPLLSTELLPQTDEGEVNVNAELPLGTRVERTEEVMIRLEEMVKQYVPEAGNLITSGGGGGQGFGQQGNSNRGSINIRLVPRDERMRSNDQNQYDAKQGQSWQ